MSNQYGKCFLCNEEMLISCTDADWSPRYLKGKPICDDCYEYIKQEVEDA